MYHSMLNKFKCYRNYPSTTFVRILGRTSLTSTFTFTISNFTSESDIFKFLFATKHISHLLGAIYLPHSQRNKSQNITKNSVGPILPFEECLVVRLPP